ncbi:nicotinic acid mononucleotide adenyltransferase [Croceivirga thetidis]|uniref:nicotinic acid mononucleotide adenyltransferase n=1 Tax=Croceivirga thetidis TaxID=2721623 RepID=UPI001B2FF4DD|nr:nicotinic acid mononucleotide adenyltransferase [Croceivirga thetidis]
MKATISLLLCLLVSSLGFSQKKEEIKHNQETNLIDAVYYHDNGEISQQGTFDLEGKLHGEWISFNEKGEEVSRGLYNNGKRVGTWFFRVQDGIKEVQFDKTGIVSVVNREGSSGVAIKN